MENGGRGGREGEKEGIKEEGVTVEEGECVGFSGGCKVVGKVVGISEGEELKQREEVPSCMA